MEKLLVTYTIRGIYGEVKISKQATSLSTFQDLETKESDCNYKYDPILDFQRFDVEVENKSTGEYLSYEKDFYGLPKGIDMDTYYRISIIQGLNLLQKTMILANGGTIIEKDKKEEEIGRVVESLGKILKDMQLPNLNFMSFMSCINNDEKVEDTPVKGGSNNSTHKYMPATKKAKEMMEKMKADRDKNK